MDWFVIILIWIGCGFLCEYLGKQKGQNGCFLLGFLLGFIGVIIVLCLKDKREEMNTTGNSDKYEKLQQLQNLKNSGAITDVEFEIEKQKILK